MVEAVLKTPLSPVTLHDRCAAVAAAARHGELSLNCDGPVNAVALVVCVAAVVAVAAVVEEVDLNSDGKM